MSDKLVDVVIVLYLAIGLVVVSAIYKIFDDNFNGFFIFCIFVWPAIIFILILFVTINLLYNFGEWIGEKISKWL